MIHARPPQKAGPSYESAGFQPTRKAKAAGTVPAKGEPPTRYYRLSYLSCIVRLPGPFIRATRAAVAEAQRHWLGSLSCSAYRGARERGIELIARQLVAQ